MESELLPAGHLQQAILTSDISWISICGIHDADHIDTNGKCFNLYPLWTCFIDIAVK